MTKSYHLAVFLPEKAAKAVKAVARRQYGSVSAYLRALIEHDQTPKVDPLRAEIDRINIRLGELLEFSRYNTVVQNATADRLGPGLLDDIQERYRKKYGSTPDAR